MHGQQNIKIATKAPCVHNVTRNFSNKRYEVITEVLYRSHVLWEVSCCQLVISHWHFEVSYCLHSHGEALQSITILGLLGPEHERPAILRNFFHYLPSQRLNVPQVLSPQLFQYTWTTESTNICFFVISQNHGTKHKSKTCVLSFFFTKDTYMNV